MFNQVKIEATQNRHADMHIRQTFATPHKAIVAQKGDWRHHHRVLCHECFSGAPIVKYIDDTLIPMIL